MREKAMNFLFKRDKVKSKYKMTDILLYFQSVAEYPKQLYSS